MGLYLSLVLVREQGANVTGDSNLNEFLLQENNHHADVEDEEIESRELVGDELETLRHK